MKLNNIGYLIKEGIRGIFLHGFMSFAAVCVTVACLLIVGSFSILAYNLDIMVEELNQTNEILVYIDENLELQDAKHVHSELSKIANISKAEFISREEALKDFVADHQDDPAFTGVQASDLRHRCKVTLIDNKLMKQTDDAIKKMVGATNGFIRLPFIVEGFTLGMMGAALAFGLEWVVYDSLVAKIAAMDSLKLFNFVPFQTLLLPMIATFCAAGFFVGIVGSWTSIRKFMDV